MFRGWRVVAACFVVAAVERQPPVRDSDQAGDQAQQRRLAGAVASGHQQRLAAADREAQAREYRAAAAGAGQVLGTKLHQAGRALSVVRRSALCGSRKFLRIFENRSSKYGARREKTL